MGPHTGIGIFKFFLNFLLLKTFPKKCVFSFCLGDMWLQAGLEHCGEGKGGEGPPQGTTPLAPV